MSEKFRRSWDRGVGNVADSACNRVGLELAIDGVCRIEELAASAGCAARASSLPTGLRVHTGQ